MFSTSSPRTSATLFDSPSGKDKILPKSQQRTGHPLPLSPRATSLGRINSKSNAYALRPHDTLNTPKQQLCFDTTPAGAAGQDREIPYAPGNRKRRGQCQPLKRANNNENAVDSTLTTKTHHRPIRPRPQQHAAPPPTTRQINLGKHPRATDSDELLPSSPTKIVRRSTRPVAAPPTPVKSDPLAPSPEDVETEKEDDEVVMVVMAKTKSEETEMEAEGDEEEEEEVMLEKQEEKTVEIIVTAARTTSEEHQLLGKRTMSTRPPEKRTPSAKVLENRMWKSEGSVFAQDAARATTPIAASIPATNSVLLGVTNPDPTLIFVESEFRLTDSKRVEFLDTSKRSRSKVGGKTIGPRTLAKMKTTPAKESRRHSLDSGVKKKSSPRHHNVLSLSRRFDPSTAAASSSSSCSPHHASRSNPWQTPVKHHHHHHHHPSSSSSSRARRNLKPIFITPNRPHSARKLFAASLTTANTVDVFPSPVFRLGHASGSYQRGSGLMPASLNLFPGTSGKAQFPYTRLPLPVFTSPNLSQFTACPPRPNLFQTCSNVWPREEAPPTPLSAIPVKIKTSADVVDVKPLGMLLRAKLLQAKAKLLSEAATLSSTNFEASTAALASVSTLTPVLHAVWPFSSSPPPSPSHSLCKEDNNPFVLTPSSANPVIVNLLPKRCGWGTTIGNGRNLLDRARRRIEQSLAAMRARERMQYIEEAKIVLGSIGYRDAGKVELITSEEGRMGIQVSPPRTRREAETRAISRSRSGSAGASSSVGYGVGRGKAGQKRTPQKVEVSAAKSVTPTRPRRPPVKISPIRKSSVPNADERNFECQHCDKRYKNRNGLVYHLQRCQSLLEEDKEDPDAVINCICSSTGDDSGPMVQCDRCEAWLHLDCVGLTEETLDDEYFCPRCTGVYMSPRRTRNGEKIGTEEEGEGRGTRVVYTDSEISENSEEEEDEEDEEVMVDGMVQRIESEMESDAENAYHIFPFEEEQGQPIELEMKIDDDDETETITNSSLLTGLDEDDEGYSAVSHPPSRSSTPIPIHPWDNSLSLLISPSGQAVISTSPASWILGVVREEDEEDDDDDVVREDDEGGFLGFPATMRNALDSRPSLMESVLDSRQKNGGAITVPKHKSRLATSITVSHPDQHQVSADEERAVQRYLEVSGDSRNSWDIGNEPPFSIFDDNPLSALDDKPSQSQSQQSRLGNHVRPIDLTSSPRRSSMINQIMLNQIRSQQASKEDLFLCSMAEGDAIDVGTSFGSPMTDHNDPHWHQASMLTGSPYLLPRCGPVSVTSDLTAPTFPLKMNAFGLRADAGANRLDLDLDLDDVQEDEDADVADDDVINSWLVSGTTPAGGMIDQELDGLIDLDVDI